MVKLPSHLLSKIRLFLANMGLVVLAEPVSLRENLWRVYCPKCKQWHLAYLSGHPGNEHFHLPCGLVVPYAARWRSRKHLSVRGPVNR